MANENGSLTTGTVMQQQVIDPDALAARVKREEKDRAKRKFGDEITALKTQVEALTAKAASADKLQAQLEELQQSSVKSGRRSAVREAAKAKGIADADIDTFVLQHAGLDAVDHTKPDAVEAFVKPFADKLVPQTPGTPGSSATAPDPKSTGSAGSPTGTTTKPLAIADIESRIKENPKWLDDPANFASMQAAMRT